MFLFSKKPFLFFGLIYQSFFLCIGIYESRHIGKDIYPMPQEIIIELSGILSDTEREKLVDYFTKQSITKSKSDIEYALFLLESKNDTAVVKWCIENNIDLVSILNLSSLRHTMIHPQKKLSPWFLKEAALLPVVCGCLNNCFIDPKICHNIAYLTFLIDQIERNHHRIETENDHQLLTDALIIIHDQLQKLHKESSHTHKKRIAQAIEKLILIQKIHTLNYQKYYKNQPCS